MTRMISAWGASMEKRRRLAEVSLSELERRSGVTRQALTVALRGLTPAQAARIEAALTEEVDGDAHHRVQ